MKKVACLLVAGAFALLGCAGGGSAPDADIIVFPDAAAGAPDAAIPDASVGPDAPPFVCTSSAVYLEPLRTLPAYMPIGTRDVSLPRPTGPVVCNPVAQTGCAVGEKCASILDDPATGASYVGCVADGTQDIGAACTDPTVAGASDDCLAGGECYNGLCHELCSTALDNCTGTGVCVQFVDGGGNDLPTQICLFGCSPLIQDCVADSEACYLIGDGGACVVPSGGTGLAIGSACMFANACVEGGICIGPAGSGVCRLMCGPVMDTWTEVDGTLTTPNCCGSNCTICKACTFSNEICGLIGDGMGGLASETVGFCTTDEDMSSATYVCDCDNAPASDICVMTGIAPPATPREPAFPMWRVR